MVLSEKQLIKEFNDISKKGWIKSINMGTGSVGLTFEREICKNLDSTFFPDFRNIEIKCTTRFSKFPISLFSCAFEGPSFPEINRVVELYGYNHYKYFDKKVLKVDLDTINLTKKGNFNFKLEIDEEENKLYLKVFDLNNNLIEKKSFIYLDTIINRLKLKLSNLVIIHASRKISNEEEYFRYYKFEKYRLINKNKILNLIKNGSVIVTLESRLGMSGDFQGKYKNKNLVFKLKRDSIESLFIKELEVDNDYGINRNCTYNENGFYIMK